MLEFQRPEAADDMQRLVNGLYVRVLEKVFVFLKSGARMVRRSVHKNNNNSTCYPARVADNMGSRAHMKTMTTKDERGQGSA